MKAQQKSVRVAPLLCPIQTKRVQTTTVRLGFIPTLRRFYCHAAGSPSKYEPFVLTLVQQTKFLATLGVLVHFGWT